MIKFSVLATAFAVLLLIGCEGKKSLDGYPMDKPPPSAYAPRDSEPTFDKSEAKEGAGATEKDTDDKK
ncbi:hypothetical protein [Nitrosomonas sp. Nm166]|uniref:hypothetical protein n=1 Tax=Nitrosomonas sp. Nm166 TaxID=1881054 RepID=UPI0008F35425|nr:hypothetical protein [Nitrosomonas sp. Nm166]SFD88851.1 hypothetical protein SAMN05428977_10022 [Nitrosomonas sp. Nm166]